MMNMNKLSIQKLGLLVVAGLTIALLAQARGKEEVKMNNEEGFTFAFMTDVHLNREHRSASDQGFEAALKHAKLNNVDFIIFGGDNTECDQMGKGDELAANEVQQRFRQKVDANGVPAYFVIGNHDRYYFNGGKRDSLGFNVFEKTLGPTYRSFNHKGVHFILLNSLYPNEDGPYSISPEEMAWLKRDLQQTGKTTPIIVCIHVPMLSLYYPVVDGNFIGADMIQNTKEVADHLMPYNVKAVLQGHQHIYEEIRERGRWFVTAGAVSAKWWSGPLMETEEGYLLVNVDAKGNVNWQYVDYGWHSHQ